MSSVLISIIVSCITSYMVSKNIIKNSFDVIDSYVKDTTDALYDAVRKLTDFRDQGTT